MHVVNAGGLEHVKHLASAARAHEQLADRSRFRVRSAHSQLDLSIMLVHSCSPRHTIFQAPGDVTPQPSACFAFSGIEVRT
jgi:hypothetical protein